MLSLLRNSYIVHFAVIDAQKRVPAHIHYVLQHLDAVAQIAYARPFIVPPGDWDLLNAVAAPGGDKENLRVKPPAVNALQLKNRPRSSPAEGLETALCVSKR